MPSPHAPTKYLGPQVFYPATVSRNRRPTSSDVIQPETGKYYIVTSLWQVGKSPTTGVQGEVWILTKIVGNVSFWVLFTNAGSSGNLFTLSDNANTVVQPSLPTSTPPDNIQFTSTGGTINVVANPTSHSINLDLAGSGGSAVETLSGNDGIHISPTDGNISIVTANTTVKFLDVAGVLTQDFGLTNLALGSSLPSLNVGTTNISYGLQAMASLTNGAGNSIVGYQAATALTTGSNNCAFGKQALINITDSVQNTAIGVSTLLALAASVGHNTCVGYGSLIALTTGNTNTALGISAGSLFTGSESSNITIGSPGIAGDNNIIRIGNQGTGA